MICAGCQTINHDDAKACVWCGGNIYEYPWCVWWRYVLGSGNTTEWHDAPKMYKSERAARMAESDLNRAYMFEVGRVQHIALRRGVHPNELYL